MIALAEQASRKTQTPDWLLRLRQRADVPMLLAVVALLCFGLVMLASASIGIAERQYGDGFYIIQRQMIYVLLGLSAGFVAYQLPLRFWQQTGWLWLILAMILLVAVLIPGIGRTVNGSARWIALGPLTVQVSEFAKLFIAFYLASYLVRHIGALREHWFGLLRPLLVVAVASILLLAEPDFGATLVLIALSLSMLFVAGARVGQFSLLLMLAIGAAVLLAYSSPYRLARLTAFMNPWADPFDSGFQLTQALIAIGSGSWFGLGLGNSVQKLFYLPEAHNDFLFAVIAEELGLFGVLLLVALFMFVLWRCFLLARRAYEQEHFYAAYLVYGFGTWIGLQAFINIGVNMGLLPTKGLTLPLMSAGGSSMLVMLVMLAIVQRVHYELMQQAIIKPKKNRYSVMKPAVVTGADHE